MMTPLRALALVALTLGAAGCHGRPVDAAEPQRPSASPAPRTIQLVEAGGIGFDDLVYSPERHQVVVPAGGTGCVDLIDTASFALRSVCAFTASAGYSGGHGTGSTSADIGGGFLFAADRTQGSLSVIDPSSQRVVAQTALGGGPDYVRWVDATQEVWVTEPSSEVIEVFAFATQEPRLSRRAPISIPGGPESLVIDSPSGAAYTHLWEGVSLRLDLRSHAVQERWQNGCRGSRGIALDPPRGFLFVGCNEGRAAVLDVNHGGRVLGSFPTASDVDIIAVSLSLNHLYVPAASDGTTRVLGVRHDGTLQSAGTLHGARGAHCVASDDRARVWVCAPDQGALLVFDDPFPATPG